MHGIKLFEHKMEIKIDGDNLIVEQNKYATNIVNAYIVCELDTWSTILSFYIKKLLVGSD